MGIVKAQNIVAVAFLWVFLTSDSYGNVMFAGATTSKEVPLNIRQLHDQTVHEIRIHCSRELKECIHFVEGLELHLSQTSNRLKSKKLDIDLLTEGMVKKVIPDSPFEEKQYLFSYLRKKQLQYYESTEDFGSKIWFNKFRELFSISPAVPRRFLRDKAAPEDTIHISQPPVSTSGSPDNSPEPSHIVPFKSPSSVVHTPTPVVHSPVQVPSHPKDRVSPPPRVFKASPSGEKKHNADMAAVIGAGCAAGLVFALLLLVCCINRRKSKVGPGNGQSLGKRDDKPLLNISASDVSAGSPIMGQYSNQNFETSSSTSTASIVVDYTDSSNVNNLATNNSSTGLLPLPPGRNAPTRPPRPPGVHEKPEAPGPPPPPPPKRAPAPPPPPKDARPLPKPGNLGKPSPLGGHNQTHSSSSEISGNSDAVKPKLKPFFWEKVMANPDSAMVWNEIKSGSFQFNEEMMESLFGVVQADKGKFDQNRRSTSSESAPTYVQLIDPKKAQNLAILLKALNVTTEEVCDALLEGNELPAELVETLLRMAPTTDEELKLRLFTGDVSQLGLAERFLKVVIEIPFAFKRMEALLYMTAFQEESASITESFATLGAACKEVTNSRLFLKLLEAVLKTGNRMNDGTYRGGAMAFKLDTLLKLSDVRGADGKTTLFHFVVQEIIRSEGLRAARRLRESVKTEHLFAEPSLDSEDYYRNLGLQVVSGLTNDLVNVRKAALIDGDTLKGAVSKLGKSLTKTKTFLANDMINVEEDSEFCTTVSNFVQDAEAQVSKLLEEERRIMALVKSTGDYFHGNAGKDEGLRLFGIVRDFLIMVDKACKEISKSIKMPAKTYKKVAFAPSPSKEPHHEAYAPSPSNEPQQEALGPSSSKEPQQEALTPSPSHEERHETMLDYHRRLFPAIQQRREDDSNYLDDSSSDDDN